MKLALVELTDEWAVRERSIVVQDLEVLPAYAQELVKMIRASGSQAR
jgi:hypothetical protein